MTALTAWFRARVREASDDVLDEDRSRRLDSDSAAVQVLTIHRCKGLEFPVVYCPFLWQPPWIPDEQLPLFHDAAAGGRRTIDAGGPTNPDFAGHKAQHVFEVHGEALRLAYVALTRAAPPDGAALGELVGQPPVATRPAALRVRHRSRRSRARYCARRERRRRTGAGDRRRAHRARLQSSPRADRALTGGHRRRRTRSCWRCDGSTARSTARGVEPRTAD